MRLPEAERSITIDAPLNKNLLELAHDNGVDLEGACEGWWMMDDG